MAKYSLTLAPFLLFAVPLNADPILDLTITSLTVSQPFGPNETEIFSGSGSGVSISGSDGIFQPPQFIYAIGSPIGTLQIGVPDSSVALIMGGFVGSTQVQLTGGATITGATNSLVPPTGTVLVPVVVSGEYMAYACAQTQAPPNCTGLQIANIFVDLNGLVTLNYSASPPLLAIGDTILESVSFASTPEPSSPLLLLLGSAGFGAVFMTQRRTKKKIPLSLVFTRTQFTQF